MYFSCSSSSNNISCIGIVLGGTVGIFVVAMIILFFVLLIKENLRPKDKVDLDEQPYVESENQDDEDQPKQGGSSYNRVENQENQI